MQYDNVVRIGPKFFSKTFNDYADKWWAIIREFVQNCVDARSSRIEIDIEERHGHAALTVTNDGQPMSREVLTVKLLSTRGEEEPSFRGDDEPNCASWRATTGATNAVAVVKVTAREDGRSPAA